MPRSIRNSVRVARIVAPETLIGPKVQLEAEVDLQPGGAAAGPTAEHIEE